MLADLSSPSLPCFEPLSNCFENNGTNNKRKRRPAGTPDPDAEVVSLSPKTLLESDRYVCEICNQGFQRDQNLQMHRRRHKVPWKLLKRTEATTVVRKRVFVCPEPSCLHHNPTHALGDLPISKLVELEAILVIVVEFSPGLLKLKEEAKEQMRMAMEEKAMAEEARNEAKKQIEMAEKELVNAKRMRQQAQAELQRALVLKEHAIKKINSTILQITCQVCRQHFHPFPKI
ncbi:protein SHOOT GRAVITROPISM 5-like [Cucumis melo var. makuwa]|uniref:Protein SHOOT GRAVITROPISM 5-like n=1 Tax=Cucumis melo var. makuwa TaxID=1194695 RepID=A0A5D3BIY7_CUCMM|nr:protein SHOOT GRAVITROPISM 5-like [Cucumis melo var. makuwa]